MECDALSDVCWARLLDSWQRYYEKAGNWWAEIYKVFSRGGDFRPVHAWLCEEQVADQVVQLMEDLREGLRACEACAADDDSARVLNILRELIDEASDYELVHLCSRFPKRDEAVPAVFAAGASRTSPEVPVAMPPEVIKGQAPGAVDTLATEVAIDDRIYPQIADGAEPEPEAAVADKAGAVEATAAPTASSQAAPLAKPEQPVLAEGDLAPEAAPQVSPENLMQEAVTREIQKVQGNYGFSRASAAAEPMFLVSYNASLPPIPAIAAEELNWLSRSLPPIPDRQAELAELVEAQAQLRHDLKRLEVAKLRLQQARRVHEEKKGNANAGMQAPSNGQAMPRSISR